MNTRPGTACHSPSTRTPGAVSRALDFVRRAVEGRSGRLPPIAQLAASAGVSYVTMWKALREARRQGLVDGVPGRRFTAAASEPAQQPELLPDKPGWQQLRDRIRADLYDSAHGVTAVLHDRKALLRRYGVSYASLRRALESLCRDGRIERHGRSYRARTLVSLRPTARIALVSPGSSAGMVDIVPTWGQEFYRAVERDCSERHIALDMLVAYVHRGRPQVISARRRVPVPLSRQSDVLGYLVVPPLWPLWYSGVMALLAATGKPVATFTTFTQLDDLLAQPASVPCRAFQLAGDERPGRAIGDFLLQLGHRRVAYVTSNPDAAWSQGRCRGLSQAFAEAGFPDAVLVWPAETVRDDYPAYQRDLRRLNLGPFMAYAAAMVRRFPNSAAASWTSLNVDLRDHLSHERTQHALRPVLRKTLTSGATALVGCNDAVALAVLDYAHSRQAPSVPARLSVVGFDDSLGALFSELTSYNFNVSGAERRAVDFLLHPEPGRGPGRIHYVAGFIVERGSTARAATEGAR